MAIPFPKIKQIACRLSLWDWGLWFGFGAFALIEFVRSSNAVLGMLGVLLLFPGIVQLAGFRWAWHAGLVSYALIGAGVAYHRLQKPLSFWTAVLLAGFVWGLWQHWNERAEIEERLKRSNQSDDDDSAGDSQSPENSLVLWLKGPRFLDEGILSRIAERAFGVSFGDSEGDEGFVVGKENHYILKLGDVWFILHHLHVNYFDDPEAVAAEMTELRRMNAVRLHEAWLSMDYLRGPDSVDQAGIMESISKMIFELAKEGDVIALYHPKTRRIAPWSDEVAGFVAEDSEGDVFTATAPVPVIRVPGDSEKMAAAVAEARKHWPEFLAAFHASQDKERFSVKAPVTEGGNTEFIWISVRAISDGKIHGMLANDPVALGDLKIGDFVTVAEEDLNDWCYPSPGDAERPRGLFTISALG